jgi:CRISPR-associated protein Cst2
MYLTILIISSSILAANNRGENVGNMQTLQRIRTPRGERTVLSGYSIKYAIRLAMQQLGARMWRRVDTDRVLIDDSLAGFIYGDNHSTGLTNAEPETPFGYDDGAFGFMRADKEKGEDDTDTDVKKAKGKKEKAKTLKIVGAVEVSPAISTTLYNQNPAFIRGLKADGHLAPFSVERHYTRYQYTITVNVPDAKKKGFDFPRFLEALRSLPVGGSHASNASEITPEILVYRFHKAPGRGGLYLGVNMDMAPDAPVDVAPLVEHCHNLGITDYVLCGPKSSLTVAEGLQNIQDRITAELADLSLVKE